MEHLELAGHALAHGHATQKPRKEMHVRELHDGSYHIMRHHGEAMTEHSAPTLDHVHDHLEEHFGEPNEGEESMAEKKVEGEA